MRIIFGVALIIVSFSSMDYLHEKLDKTRLNYFDTDLFRFSAEDKTGNVMVSPASIKSVLAMILEGAIGITSVEIRSALRLHPTKNEFREQLREYLLALQANTTGAYLHNANVVFVSNKLKLKKEYELMLQKVYLVEMRKVNFQDPSPAAEYINGWVKEKSKGLIPHIVDSVNIQPHTDVLLLNALYFKSTWKHAFNPQLTRGGCFYRNGICTTVAMMELYTELNYTYVDNLRAHALELPYEGGRYSMILLVPIERDGCAALIRDLPYVSLSQISEMFVPLNVQLAMPKFTIDYNEDIILTLNKMKINSLFTSNANLSGIFDGNSTHVNNILHRVHMSVDEEGTVAAAATNAMVVPLIDNGVHLTVDRPFVVFIRDNDFGLVLFEGKIEEPTKYVEPNKFNKHTSNKTKVK